MSKRGTETMVFRLWRNTRPRRPRQQHVFVFIPVGAEPKFVAETSFGGIFCREDRICRSDEELHLFALQQCQLYVGDLDTLDLVTITIEHDFPNRFGQLGVDRYVPVFIRLTDQQQLEESHMLRDLQTTGFGKQISNLLVLEAERPAATLAAKQ